ncbi:MAG: AMP-binding protein [Gammaproteobacteria bacterium]
MNQISSFFPPASSLDSWGGDIIALIFAGEEIGYPDLSQQARALAAFLTGRGVQEGELVAVLSPSSLTVLQVLYAALNLGLAVFTLDPLMDRERRNRLLAQAGCSLVLSDIELQDIPNGVEIIQLDYPIETDEVLESGGNRGEVQLIIATSGSEGEPKGVMLSGGNIASSVAASRNRLGLESGHLWLNCLPMFHVGGVMVAYRCLDAGAGMLLHPGFDADQVWADLNRYQVTHISLVPAMLARLLDLTKDAAPPDCLRVALIGGGHLSPLLAFRAREAGWPLCVSYGMSETCSQCATDCGDAAGLIAGQVGLPLDGFEIALSEQGRIMLLGPAVMRGYANPDLAPGLGCWMRQVACGCWVGQMIC